MLRLLILGYALLYAVLSWRRFASFHAQIDLSYYLRLIWGLGHGHYDLPLVQARNVIGLHLEPIVLPLVLLGRLGIPLAPLLLIVQAAAVALLAWPAYRLGERHLGLGKSGGAVAAAIALLYPTVSVATLHDFHPVTLALSPLLAAIDALDEGRLRRALLFAGLALLCREDIALQLLCLFAAYAAFSGPLSLQLKTPRSRLAFGAMLLGLFVYFFGYVLWLQPRYVPASGSYGLHFAKLGGEVHSGRDLVLALLRHPGQFLLLLFHNDGERLRYAWLLLYPLSLLPLLAPRALAGALPVLGINLLSSFPRVLRLESHYTTALVPFVVGAGIIGAGRLRAWLSRHELPEAVSAAAISLLMLAAGTTAHVFHGGSPLALRSERFAWSLFCDGPTAAALRQAVAAVPASASVAARPGPLAHLADRPRAMSPPEYDDGQAVDVTLHDE